jgi:hypothetical protein
MIIITKYIRLLCKKINKTKIIYFIWRIWQLIKSGWQPYFIHQLHLNSSLLVGNKLTPSGVLYTDFIGRLSPTTTQSAVLPIKFKFRDHLTSPGLAYFQILLARIYEPLVLVNTVISWIRLADLNPCTMYMSSLGWRKHGLIIQVTC